MKKTKKKKSAAFLITLIFVIVAATIFLAVKYIPSLKTGETENASKAIKNAAFYRDLDIEKISFKDDDGAYSLKNGEFYRNGSKIDPANNARTTERILRLALFYQWLKEEPILFSENIDTKEIGTSIDLLKRSREEIVKKDGDTVSSKEANKLYSLFPLSFLEAFQRSSEQFKKLSGDVSEDNSTELIKLIENTAEKYGENISGLRKNLDEYMTSNKKNNSRLLFLGGRTLVQPEIYSQDLAIMQKNYSALLEKVSRLKKCLEISAVFCERPALAETDQKNPDTAPAENISFADRILSKKELGIETLPEISAPYGISSPCWGDNKIHHIYNWSRCAKGSCFEWSILADDVFFRKTTTQFSEDKNWLAKGVSLVPLNATSPYSCNNLEYKPALETMDYFYKKYNNDRLFEKLSADGVPENLRYIFNSGTEAERSFFDAKYPDDGSFKKLSDSYRLAYAESAKNVLFDRKERADLLERYIISAEKMANFHMTLNRVIFHLNSYAKKIDSNDTALDVFYLYGARNNYSLLFMNFSPFVWITDEHPSYLVFPDKLVKANLSKMSSIIDFNEAVSRFGENTIINWQKQFVENKEFLTE